MVKLYCIIRRTTALATPLCVHRTADRAKCFAKLEQLRGDYPTAVFWIDTEMRTPRQ